MEKNKKYKEERSPQALWKKFLEAHPQYENQEQPESWFFCDNEKDANECAGLVAKGIKKATSPSLWWFEKNGNKLPEPGDLNIVTDWYGNAWAIIRTTKVALVPFNEISQEYAETEGEGDRSLEYWKKVHWDFYSREMEPFGEKPTDDMLIVCEYFEVLERW